MNREEIEKEIGKAKGIIERHRTLLREMRGSMQDHINEINRYKKLLEELQAQKSKVWKPQLRELYWYISAGNYIFHVIWENDAFDNNVYAMGNCYRTEEECKFAKEKQKVVTELQRYADEHNEGEFDWHDFGQLKHFFDYNFRDKCLDFDCIYWYKSANETYFTSEEIAQDAVKAVGEDRIKKYLFEVKG